MISNIRDTTTETIVEVIFACVAAGLCYLGTENHWLSALAAWFSWRQTGDGFGINDLARGINLLGRKIDEAERNTNEKIVEALR